MAQINKGLAKSKTTSINSPQGFFKPMSDPSAIQPQADYYGMSQGVSQMPGIAGTGPNDYYGMAQGGDGSANALANYTPSLAQPASTPVVGQGANGPQQFLNKFLGTKYGNQEGLVGNGYAYTNADTGAQDFVSLNPEQMDAVQNPTQGSDVGGSTSGMGMAGYADMGLKGVQALTGLAGAYLANKNYKLAKEKFGFEKEAANRGIIDQAKSYNTNLQNAGEVGMSLAGNTMDASARAGRQAQLDSQKLSEARIG